MNAKKKGIDQKISNGFFPSYWSHFEHKLNLFWVMYNYVPERHLAPGWNSWPRVLRQKYQSETETACRAQLAMPCSQVYCPCSSVRPLFLTKPGVTTTHIHPETKITHYYHHHHHHHCGNNKIPQIHELYIWHCLLLSLWHTKDQALQILPQTNSNQD